VWGAGLGRDWDEGWGGGGSGGGGGGLDALTSVRGRDRLETCYRDQAPPFVRSVDTASIKAAFVAEAERRESDRRSSQAVVFCRPQIGNAADCLARSVRQTRDQHRRHDRCSLNHRSGWPTAAQVNEHIAARSEPRSRYPVRAGRGPGPPCEGENLAPNSVVERRVVKAPAKNDQQIAQEAGVTGDNPDSTPTSGPTRDVAIISLRFIAKVEPSNWVRLGLPSSTPLSM